jgi:two-component system, sensor histidine kinase and response regulator
MDHDARGRDLDATARLGAIVASSVDAIVGTNPDSIVTDWNPAAERLFGYTAAEIVGRHSSCRKKSWLRAA